MVGRLKYLGSEGFCVEYEEDDIYVIWRPGTSQAAEKPTKWANEAWPKLEQVPENLLRDLIGSQASFAGELEVEETAVTMRGRLDDGGSITIGYVKGISAPRLSESEQQHGTDKLKAFARSHLQSH